MTHRAGRAASLPPTAKPPPTANAALPPTGPPTRLPREPPNAALLPHRAMPVQPPTQLPQNAPLCKMPPVNQPPPPPGPPPSPPPPPGPPPSHLVRDLLPVPGRRAEAPQTPAAVPTPPGLAALTPATAPPEALRHQSEAAAAAAAAATAPPPTAAAGLAALTPATVVVASHGLNWRQPLQGHVFVDLRKLARSYGYARAPGGGVTTSGLAPAIRSSLESNTEFQRLLFQVNDIVHRLVHEKQTRIHIGVACNWGKHRSVAFAEAVAELLRDCTELPLDGVDTISSGGGGMRTPLFVLT